MSDDVFELADLRKRHAESLSNEELLFLFGDQYHSKNESCCGCGECEICEDLKRYGTEVMRRMGGGSFDAVAKWTKDLP